ncbi:MAG: hypothetical protein BGO49_04445 [Planctomycetales bacterium 71-10]|nr:MAG: hypothetical protein BGO49_04445 [Planctomycetales bacterium 71-10]
MERPPADRITQAELSHLKAAGEKSKDAIVVYETAKRSVLAKVREGLPVEDGDLYPVLSTREEKRVTNAEIARLMGPEVLEEMRAQLRPTVSESLKVECRAVVAPPAGPAEPETAGGLGYRRFSRAVNHFAIAALAILATAGPARAQQLPTGRAEVVTTEPRLGSVVANAPIPAEMHIRNEGSDVDGAGLCVISSILANGMYQGVPGLESGKGSELWKRAKAEPGGYYPEKLEKLLKEVLPDEKWFSWEGEGTDLVRAYNAKGYPVGSTTNTGELYEGKPVHHMISDAHLDEAVACIIDNNDPGKYRWVTAAEFARRFPDGGKGWGFVWLRLPPGLDDSLYYAAALLLASAALLLPSNLLWLMAARNAYRASTAVRPS